MPVPTQLSDLSATASANSPAATDTLSTADDNIRALASILARISAGTDALATPTFSGNTTLSGGTANGVVYLNGSKVATSGSALTFDGTTLGVSSGASTSNINLTATGTTAAGYVSVGASGNNLQFTSGNAVTGILNSSAELLLKTAVNSNNARFAIKNNDGSQEWGFGTVGNNAPYYVLNASGTGVSLTNGSTSWSASSDESLKVLYGPITNASQKLKAIRTETGRYIKDHESVSRAFFIAQDWEKVFPQVVTEDNGKLLLAYSETPVLIAAAVNEHTDEIESLKSVIASLTEKIVALESK